MPTTYTGSTVGAQNLMGGASCGGGGTRAPDASFLFTAPASDSYQIDTLGSAFDTVLYLRDGTCTGAQLACNDDANGTRQSLVTVALSAGQAVVIVVDGYSTQSGAFTLNIAALSAPTPASTLTPTGTPIAVPTNTASLTATLTATLTPTPIPTSTPAPSTTATPTAAPSASQTPTTVPSGTPTATRTPSQIPTNTPTATSPPAATPSATSVSTGTTPPTPTATMAAACPQTVLGTSLPISYTGSTLVAENLVGGASCGGGGTRAPDASFLFTAPATDSYQIDTLGSVFDTVLYVRDGSCAGTQVACNDDANGTRQSLVTVALSAGQPVVIVVDGYSTQSGAFTLNIRALSAPTATPTTMPTPSSSPASTALPTATPTRTSSATPTAAATVTSTPGQTPTLTPTPTGAPTPTPTNTPPLAATATPTRTPSVTPTPSRTATPVATPTASATATATATPVSALLTLAASQDAWLDAAHPTQNKGTDTKLHVRSSGPVRHALLQFELSTIPADACVGAASLNLTLTSVGTISRTYELHRVGASWTEAAVTWINRQAAVSWTAPGGDFGAVTAIAPTGRTTATVVSWDVTADVAAFVTGAVPNNGWLIKDAAEGSGAVEFQFAARENGTLASRPQLVVALSPCH